jgi:hypothetical protein
MDIPVNVLKNYLCDVYFFCGTTCGGKTTISRAFAEKHGFQWLSEDVMNDKYVLDSKIELPSRAKKYDLLKAANGHIIQHGSITGVFE